MTVVFGTLGASLALLAVSVWLEALVVALVTGRPWAEALGLTARDPGALTLAQLFSLGLPLAVGASMIDGGARGLLERALRPAPPSALLLACVAGVALQLPMVELAHVVADVSPALARSPEQEAALRETLGIHDLYSALTVPLAVVVLAPLTEELLFRAFAQGELMRVVGRRAELRPLVVAVVAALFSAFHLEPSSLLSIFLAGLALGALTERAGSVLPAILMHAGVNAVPVALSHELVPIRGFNDADPTAHVEGWLVLASLLVFALALALTLRRLGARAEAPTRAA